MSPSLPVFKRFQGLQSFEAIDKNMRQRIEEFGETSPGEIWLMSFEPVYTNGRRQNEADFIAPQPGIPLVVTDRGGLVTYHGPGQLVIYPLIQPKQFGLRTREYVMLLEQLVIDICHHYGVSAKACRERPGVYVNDEKIASVGVRFQKGWSLHGLAFNIDMDLSPFQAINPCGYAGLRMTQLKSHAPTANIESVTQLVILNLIKQLQACLEQTHEQPAACH